MRAVFPVLRGNRELGVGVWLGGQDLVIRSAAIAKPLLYNERPSIISKVYNPRLDTQAFAAYTVLVYRKVFII